MQYTHNQCAYVCICVCKVKYDKEPASDGSPSYASIYYAADVVMAAIRDQFQCFVCKLTLPLAAANIFNSDFGFYFEYPI